MNAQALATEDGKIWSSLTDDVRSMYREVASATVDVEALPEIFRVRLGDPAVEEKFETPGVRAERECSDCGTFGPVIVFETWSGTQIALCGRDFGYDTYVSIAK